MKKITWLRGGFWMKGPGHAIAGKTVKVDDAFAEDVIQRGLARAAGKVKEPPTLDISDMSKQDLVTALMNKGVKAEDIPDRETRAELGERLKKIEEG